MTQTLDNPNVVIAQWLATHGRPDLAWVPAARCPQGHSNHDTDGDPVLPVGSLCDSCRQDATRPRWLALVREGMLTTDAIQQVQAEFRQEQAAHADDPTWHREWQIEPEADEFSDPSVLYDGIEAYCAFYDERVRFAERYVGAHRYEATLIDGVQPALVRTDCGHQGLRDAWAEAIRLGFGQS